MEIWPEAISDGLNLSCGLCGVVPKYDHRVDDDVWRELVPEEHRLSVVCLPCLDRLANERGILIGEHLESVQFTGEQHTVVLAPTRVVRYADYPDSAAGRKVATAPAPSDSRD